MTETKKEYLKRINRVIGYIERNLDGDLGLVGLAGLVYFSQFHFHRIFSAVVGESLNVFVVRKRIERIAAILAVGTDVPLVELAYRYGFEHPSSFSRAFKKFYGVSPTEFRRNGVDRLRKIGIGVVSEEHYICSMSNCLKWLNMHAKIEVLVLPEIRLAGLVHVGKPELIGDTYERLFQWAYAKGLAQLPGFKAVTVYHDNPRITEAAYVRQSACVTLEEGVSTDGDISPLSIRAGRYVIGHVELLPAQFPKAWESMCVWVMEHGFAFRDGDYFEVYRNDYRTHPEHKFLVDICIPVEAGKGQVLAPSASMRVQGFMKQLRAYFIRQYPVGYVVGSLYSDEQTITYFPCTPTSLKEQHLKIALVFNHPANRFEVWLAGQNKRVQKAYWELFKGSDWNTYHIPSSIDGGFSIVDTVLVEQPDFADGTCLTERIESGTMAFIRELTRVLG
jgi:DNA gyrase inhibitor GyrI/AraC-like DNA-binding protein